jgi:hypothetical protein
MPVKMREKLFRLRVLDFQTHRALNEIQPIRYLTQALDSKEIAVELARLFQVKLGDSTDKDNTRPGQRFINMVHRDDDISHWVDFLCHEQKREDSPWKSKVLLPLPKKLKAWRASLDPLYSHERPYDLVVRQVEQALENVVQGLEADERVSIGLRAFRAMLWQLRTGGEEE